MNGIRVLVVDDHTALRNSIMEHLRMQHDIGAVMEAGNGEEALTILMKEPIDVMVTDLIMPKMDGYALLEALQQMQLSPMPKTIAITALKRDDLVVRAIDLGVGFYLPKPISLDNLTARIRELAEQQPRHVRISAMPAAAAKVQNIDERLGKLFLTIGIPAHIKGFQYLRDGVKMVVSDPNIINSITKELYPGIATHFTTSASKVERAIRHAIEVAWNRGRVESLNSAFGCRVCTPEDKPTNGEFIAMIADKLSPEYTGHLS